MLNVPQPLGMHGESAKECSRDQGFFRFTLVHRNDHMPGTEEGGVTGASSIGRLL